MTTQSYPTTVDYSLSVEELIKLGNYDWASNNINNDNFPDLLIKSIKEELEITLFGFNKNHSSEWVIKHLQSKGYRPATLKELLSLGAQHPDLQLNDWIIALGSTWRHPYGDLRVPCLCRVVSYRNLDLGWFGGGWHPGRRFAAVKLDTEALKPSDTKDTSDTLTLGDLVSDMDKLVNDFYKESDEIIKKMKNYELSK